MKNKVEIINSAIGQCKRLMNNETIVFHGLHTMKITRGDLTDDQLQGRINELEEEKQGLYMRIKRMER